MVEMEKTKQEKYALEGIVPLADSTFYQALSSYLLLADNVLASECMGSVKTLHLSARLLS